MKKFLVLGIGPAQNDLLRYLQGRYIRHACSNTDEGPGRTQVEHFARINIADKEGVLAYCREHEIDLVYSTGSDLAMPTIAWVSEQMHLPRLVDPATAEACQNKEEMRRRLVDTPGAVRYQSVRSVDESLQLPFPLILKPADSQGQRGVGVVRSEHEYRAHFPLALSHSRSGAVILEEPIEGPEISVHTFLSGGTVRWTLMSDRVTWPDHPGGIIHKHAIPCTIGDRARSRVLELVGEVTQRLGIHEGPAYFQIKMAGEEPRLIEATPRLDGCHMWRLLKYATGDDLLDGTIRLLDGGTYTLHDSPRAEGAWVLEFFCAPPDTVFRRGDFTPKKESVYTEWFYGEWRKVKRINGYMEKCGYQIYPV